MKPGDMIEVHWLDSMATHGWSAEIPTTKDLDTRTVGIFVREDEESLTVAFGHQEVGTYLCSMTIPRITLQKVTRLRR